MHYEPVRTYDDYIGFKRVKQRVMTDGQVSLLTRGHTHRRNRRGFVSVDRRAG